jgi:hypothetical protein
MNKPFVALSVLFGLLPVPAASQSDSTASAFKAQALSYSSCTIFESRLLAVDTPSSSTTEAAATDLAESLADAASLCVRDMIDGGEPSSVTVLPRSILAKSCLFLRQRDDDIAACNHWYSSAP